ncbi:LURP-one-related family protein [Vagococcus carniphilus]|uniref:LURP-one-related/scramblase family protein n=1 Tax=Vagococcus carniphilus TaxID=218144 RepID=UPI00288F6779|nr:LURP-one-related family protein [Vagococcus carniphilus]MDT2815419.1 LURP-one-related family protein [Vagococcus carniphilus]
MRTLFMKQKMLSFNEKFAITDEDGSIIYRVHGSLFKIPKSFSMVDQNDEQIGTVTKELFKLLPKFTVDVFDDSPILIEKEFTFFKPKYRIKSENIQIDGDWLDKNFDIYRGNKKIAHISEKWLAMSSTYEINIFDQSYEHLIVLLVAAIDFVHAEERAASSASNP